MRGHLALAGLALMVTLSSADESGRWSRPASGKRLGDWVPLNPHYPEQVPQGSLHLSSVLTPPVKDSLRDYSSNSPHYIQATRHQIGPDSERNEKLLPLPHAAQLLSQQQYLQQQNHPPLQRPNIPQYLNQQFFPTNEPGFHHFVPGPHGSQLVLQQPPFLNGLPPQPQFSDNPQYIPQYNNQQPQPEIPSKPSQFLSSQFPTSLSNFPKSQFSSVLPHHLMNQQPVPQGPQTPQPENISIRPTSEKHNEKEQVQILYVPVEALKQRGQQAFLNPDQSKGLKQLRVKPEPTPLEPEKFIHPIQPLKDQKPASIKEIKGFRLGSSNVVSTEAAIQQNKVSTRFPIESETQNQVYEVASSTPMLPVEPKPTKAKVAPVPPLPVWEGASQQTQPSSLSKYYEQSLVSYQPTSPNLLRNINGLQQDSSQAHFGVAPPLPLPPPNQPPLSVYMETSRNKRVGDVLSYLKNSKTIPVLDTIGPDAPQVFVGPSTLSPPPGYVKFDLPYLNSLEVNRIEDLPFFVAPLNFQPPEGFSKIPFPAPHIGSVVISNSSLTTEEPRTPEPVRPTAATEPGPSDYYNVVSDVTLINQQLPSLINSLQEDKLTSPAATEATVPTTRPTTTEPSTPTYTVPQSTRGSYRGSHRAHSSTTTASAPRRQPSRHRRPYNGRPYSKKYPETTTTTSTASTPSYLQESVEEYTERVVTKPDSVSSQSISDSANFEYGNQYVQGNFPQYQEEERQTTRQPAQPTRPVLPVQSAQPVHSQFVTPVPSRPTKEDYLVHNVRINPDYLHNSTNPSLYSVYDSDTVRPPTRVYDSQSIPQHRFPADNAPTNWEEQQPVSHRPTYAPEQVAIPQTVPYRFRPESSLPDHIPPSQPEYYQHRPSNQPSQQYVPETPTHLPSQYESEETSTKAHHHFSTNYPEEGNSHKSQEEEEVTRAPEVEDSHRLTKPRVTKYRVRGKTSSRTSSQSSEEDRTNYRVTTTEEPTTKSTAKPVVVRVRGRVRAKPSARTTTTTEPPNYPSFVTARPKTTEPAYYAEEDLKETVVQDYSKEIDQPRPHKPVRRPSYRPASSSSTTPTPSTGTRYLIRTRKPSTATTTKLQSTRSRIRRPTAATTTTPASVPDSTDWTAKDNLVNYPPTASFEDNQPVYKPTTLPPVSRYYTPTKEYEPAEDYFPAQEKRPLRVNVRPSESEEETERPVRRPVRPTRPVVSSQEEEYEVRRPALKTRKESKDNYWNTAVTIQQSKSYEYTPEPVQATTPSPVRSQKTPANHKPAYDYDEDYPLPEPTQFTSSDQAPFPSNEQKITLSAVKPVDEVGKESQYPTKDFSEEQDDSERQLELAISTEMDHVNSKMYVTPAAVSAPLITESSQVFSTERATEKKPSRRRGTWVRVRVKKPKDVFEAAESQSFGSLPVNLLQVPVKHDANNKGTKSSKNKENVTSVDVGTSVTEESLMAVMPDILKIVLKPNDVLPTRTVGILNITEVEPGTVTEGEAVEVVSTTEAAATSTEPITTEAYPEDDLTTTEIPSTTPLPPSSTDPTKILGTSTTTEISLETEICYQGRCVKTKVSKDNHKYNSDLLASP